MAAPPPEEASLQSRISKSLFSTISDSLFGREAVADVLLRGKGIYCHFEFAAVDYNSLYRGVKRANVMKSKRALVDTEQTQISHHLCCHVLLC